MRALRRALRCVVPRSLRLGFHIPCRVNSSLKTLKLTTTPTSLPATSVYAIPYRTCLPLRHPASRIFGLQQLRFAGQRRLFCLITVTQQHYRRIPSIEQREFLDDDLDAVEDLLAGADIKLKLVESVVYSKCAHFYNLVPLEWFSVTLNTNATLTLSNYAGYLTMTVCYFCLMVPSVLIFAKTRSQSDHCVASQFLCSRWRSL
jgi:hypothetical protein